METKITLAVLAIAAVAAAAIIGTGLHGWPQPEQGDTKIGAILSLSGDFSIFGTSMQKGIELALDELDADYEIIFEDDEGVDITKSVEATRKLLSVDGADVVMITAINNGKSVSPIYEEEKTPLIVLFDASREIEPGDYTFGIGFSVEGAGHAMADFAYVNLSARRVSIVYSFDDWSILIATSFKERFEELGGEAVLFEGTAAEEKDFRTLITKSRQTDAIYAPLLFPGQMIKQAKETGYSGYLLSADGLTPDQIDAAGDAAEGVYFTNPPVLESEIFVKLQQAYREKYGNEPNIPALTAIGYDAMMAIHKARKTGDIHSGLYEISFEGATGLVDFGETGMSPRQEQIFVVKNGTAVPV